MAEIKDAKNYLDKRLEEVSSLIGNTSVLQSIINEIDDIKKQISSLDSSVKTVKTKVDKLEKDKGSK